MTAEVEQSNDMGDLEEDNDENPRKTTFLLHTGSAKVSVSASHGSKKRAKGKLHVSENPELPWNGRARCLAAFNTVWDRIQKVIEDIMDGQNHDLYQELQRWLCNKQYGDAQQSLCQYVKAPSFSKMSVDSDIKWPKKTSILSRQLHTALLFLGGIDASDHQRTFDGLIGHLQAHKCHVARLTSLDFSPKAGVGGALRVLFRQLIECIPETTALEVLLAWYQEPCNHGLPVVVLIENPESCEAKVLGELIMLLSDWIEELPVFLVMGLATTWEALSKLLPANSLVRLHLWPFFLKPPPELLEVVMRAVLIDSFCAFEFSHSAVEFLFRFFQGQDHSVTAISRALKIASMEHFWKEPLSFLCGNLLKCNSKSELEKECLSLPQEFLTHATDLPSVARLSSDKKTNVLLRTTMAESLWQLRTHKKMWAMAFLCLQSVGKQAGIGFSELLCEALLGSFIVISADEASVGNRSKEKEAPEVHRTVVTKVFAKLRDMPVSSLKSVLEDWRKVTMHEEELHKDVCHLLLNLEAGVKEKDLRCPDDSKVSSKDYTVNVMNRSKLRRIGQQQMLLSRKNGAFHSSAKDLLQRILSRFLVPPETLPFNEIFCFKEVDGLKQAMIAHTRKGVHLDLLNSQHAIKCTCCPKNGLLSSSLHDTALAYTLSQDYGDLIDVHSWYQSFMAICNSENIQQSGGHKKKRQRKKSSKDMDPVPVENTSIEARFTRAATELQIVGLLHLPKKGQSDSLRRIRI